MVSKFVFALINMLLGVILESYFKSSMFAF